MKPDVVAQVLPIVLLLGLLYLMVIRPARRRARQVSTLQAALSAGDEVMLTSGIYGRVESVEGERVRIRVDEAVVLTAHRGAVASIITDVPAQDTATDDANADPDDDADLNPDDSDRGAS